MVGKILTPEENNLSLTIPRDMIGRKVKIIAFALEDEAEAIEQLSAELSANEEPIPIPQWQRDLVLAEKKRIENDPSILMEWETVKTKLKTRNK